MVDARKDSLTENHPLLVLFTNSPPQSILFMFGRADDGQLGLGDTSDRFIPTAVEHLRRENVISVACGSGHTLALTRHGKIYGWGRNDDGRIGCGDSGWKYIPKFIEALQHETMKIIASGSYHSVAVSATGILFSWGGGLFGKLGVGDESGHLSPVRVEGMYGRSVVSVACGSRHTCCLTNEGEVYSWGDTEFTGHLSGDSAQYTPRLIETLRGVNIVSIGACGFHTGAVADDGLVYTFGDGKFGRLAHGNEHGCLIPRPVEALRGRRVTMFAAGGFHSCFVTDTGLLFTSGGNEHGQLGQGDRVNRKTPTIVDSLLGRVVTQISAGWSHNICLCDESEVYTWGNADHGKCGHGDTNRLTVPRLVEHLRGLRIMQVASYNEHTAVIVALTDDPFVSTSTSVTETTESHLIRDLRRLLTAAADEFSDISFVVEGRKISAHKAILSARCEHFRAMFHSGMRESVECEIEISFTRFEIFSALLEYLYTEKVTSLTGNDAIELYTLADMYRVEDLKAICKDVVVRGLTLQSAPRLLSMCDEFSAIQLYETCLGYVIRHFDVISRTKEFSELSKELMLEVVQRRVPITTPVALLTSPTNSTGAGSSSSPQRR